MFVDASVVVAVLNQESGWQELVKQLNGGTTQRHVSPLVRFEAVMAIARSRAGGRRPTPELVSTAAQIVDDFVVDISAEELSISSEIGSTAIEAATRYGRVVGHPADLNFGDCFAYACAKTLKAKLLYKGNDFSQTDLA